jgi:hypothetical protein
MGVIEAISGWFGALKLPGRVVFGLFLFCLSCSWSSTTRAS